MFMKFSEIPCPILYQFLSCPTESFRSTTDSLSSSYINPLPPCNLCLYLLSIILPSNLSGMYTLLLPSPPPYLSPSPRPLPLMP